MTREEQIKFYQDEDLRRVASTPEGKRLLYRLFEKTSLNKNLFTNNGHTAFKLGQKRIGDDFFYHLKELDKDLFVAVLFAVQEDPILIFENNSEQGELYDD